MTDSRDASSIPPTAGPSADDAELALVMETYLTDVEAGRTPVIEEILAAHPRIADRLRACLSTIQFVEGAASPISAVPHEASAHGQEQRLGDFRLIRELGRGGMGVVYEAEQVSLHRRVALKVLPFAAVLDAKQIQRFKNEAQAAALLHHTNIVPVFAVGCERGLHYYAMQYIDGRTLAKAIEELREEARALPGRELKSARSRRVASPSSHRAAKFFVSAAALGVQAAEALAHAHELGVIHRDIKPSNLLLDSRGNLWVTDFGLARIQADSRLTLSGDVLGTLAYMSPEQVLAKRELIDHRTDIYSLGATFYELLTLEPAFRGADREQVLHQIACEEPRALRQIDRSIPADLETIVLKAMSKEPRDRYGSANDLADDLRRYLENKPITARRPWLARRAAKWSRRHKPLVAAAAAVLISVAAVSVLIGKQLGEERAHRESLYEASLRRAVVKIELERRPHAWIAGSRIRSAEDGPWVKSLEEAVAAAHRCVALFPARPDAYYHLARGLLLLGRQDEAREALARALGCDAGFVPALVVLAEVEEKEEWPEPPASAALWVQPWLEARRARRDLRWTDAIAAYGRLLHVTSGRPEPYLGLAMEARLARGRVSLELKDFDAALEDFAGAHALWPELVEPVLLLARTYCAKGNLEHAEAHFERLYQSPLRPREAGIDPVPRDEIALAVASVYHDVSEYSRALGWAEKTGESAARELERADFLMHLGRVDAALAAAKRAVELDPGSAEARIQHGTALAHKGRVEEAVRELRRAIDLAPQLSWPHVALSIVLQERGEFDGAVRALKEALRVSPGNPILQVDLGNALRSRGQLDEAAAAYRAVLEVHQNHASARANLALVLLRQGRPEEAIAEVRRAVAIEPRNAEYQAVLGWVLAEGGQSDEGLAEMRKGIELDPKHVTARQMLGQALAKRGLHREALRELTQALTLDPKAREVCVDLRDLLETAAGIEPSEELDRLAGAVDQALRDGVDHETLWALVASLSRKLPQVEGENAARAASFARRLLEKESRGEP